MTWAEVAAASAGPTPLATFNLAAPVMGADGSAVPIKRPLPTASKQQTKPLPSLLSSKWVQNRGPRKLYTSKELITLGNMPSNIQLKSLNVGPYLTIRWKASIETESFSLYQAFPRALAVAFSDVCRQSKQGTVTIVGSSHQRIKKVFQYMLDSAKGQGCSPPPVPEQLRYCTYVKNAVDASLVDVPLLEQEYETRRIMIENMQVHSADVEEIYRDPTTKGVAVRDNVARSIARKSFSKTLKAYPVYMSLRRQLPEFDTDVKRVLEELRKPIEEEKQRVRQEERRVKQEAQRQAWAQQRAAAYHAQAARRAKDQTVPRIKAPQAPTRQPRTAVEVQTSLGTVWAAVPVEKQAKGRGQNGPTKKAIPAGEASSLDKTVDKSTSPEPQPMNWADEMAEQDERMAIPPRMGGLEGQGGQAEGGK